jgi:ribonuclease D
MAYAGVFCQSLTVILRIPTNRIAEDLPMAASPQMAQMAHVKIHVHKGDLPDGLAFPRGVAVDSETLGLKPHRDRLCVLQLSGGDGVAHLVQFDGKNYTAPRLKTLLEDAKTLKIFHFARFDVAVLRKYLGVTVAPLYCTKIASKLVRTYTDRHGLKDLSAELLGLEMSKQQQSSDWAAATLSDAQRAYAASDVLHLHALKAKLDMMLEREGRGAMAEACFKFLPERAALDLAGFDDVDVFSH